MGGHFARVMETKTRVLCQNNLNFNNCLPRHFGNFVIRIEVDVQLHQQLVSQLFNNLCINVGTSVAEFRHTICSRASFWISMNGKLR